MLWSHIVAVEGELEITLPQFFLNKSDGNLSGRAVIASEKGPFGGVARIAVRGALGTLGP